MKLLWRGDLLSTAIQTMDFLMLILGPILILFAISLVSMVGFIYFTIHIPYNHPTQLDPTLPRTEHPIRLIMRIMDMIFAMYLLYSIAFHYFMAVITCPGITRRDMIEPIAVINSLQSY